MNRPLGINRFVLTDYLMSLLVWAIFFGWRKYLVYQQVFFEDFYKEPVFFFGILSIPFFWLSLYLLGGNYKKSLYEKSRLNELTQVVFINLLGVLIIFFVLLIDDIEAANDINYYYKVFFSLFILQTVSILSGRFFWLSIVKKQIALGKAGFAVLLMGSGQKAVKAYNSIKGDENLTGWRVQGFLTRHTHEKKMIEHLVPHLGTQDEIIKVLKDYAIDKVVIAEEKTENTSNELISVLAEKDIDLYLVPGLMDIIKGSVRSSSVVNGQFIEVQTNPMSGWQQNIKRLIDVSFSTLSLLLLWPLLAFTAIRVRLSTPGSIIYKQERVGYKGKPFMIYKFRSMVQDAEPKGPALSSDNDPRITNWGRTMRKWRLDELPQLWNIIRGDMSLIGPRPERAFYIEQIKSINPYYSLLLKVKPGLTSWGMVQFGYASTVEEMVERMEYDLIYIDNASILLDFKIMIHTLNIIWKGKGK